MIYKFKSAASGDVLMMGPNGDAFMRILGREPAAKGIIEPPQMSAAMAAITQAIAADEAARQDAEREAQAQGQSLPPRGDNVALRQRLWPMMDMLQRALADDVPVVWGV